jgi:hypothetical protein
VKFRNLAAVVLALLLVALAALLASVALSDSGARGTSGGAGCRDRGWAGTASGKPAALSSWRGRSFYVWRDARRWHLGVRGATGSAPLTGQVHASAPLRVLTASGVQPALSAGARTLTIRTDASRLASVAFTASCATRLDFKLSADQPSSLRIFLGAVGRAPASTFRLHRPASTGVSGRILLMPACPVGGGTCPPAKPTKGTVRIETVTGKGGGGGQVIARVDSDENGNYAAGIPSGRYQLIAEKSGGYPVAKPSLATVEAGVITLANVYLDSGIR